MSGMKKIIFLASILLILFGLGTVFAAYDDTYTPLANLDIPYSSSVNVRPSVGDIKQQVPVTYSVDFTKTSCYAWNYDGDYVVDNDEDAAYLKLPKKNLSPYETPTSAAEPLVEVCFGDAAKSIVNGRAQTYDVYLTINKVKITNLTNSTKKMAYLQIFKIGQSDIPWLSNYTYDSSFKKQSGKHDDVISKGVGYEISLWIDGPEGSFIFGAQDIDVYRSYDDKYGSYSEGFNLPFTQGWSLIDVYNLKISTGSTLIGRIQDGCVKIRGTQLTGDTGQPASEKAGFSVPILRNSVTMTWTAGHPCGTALMDIGVAENIDTINPTVSVANVTYPTSQVTLQLRDSGGSNIEGFYVLANGSSGNSLEYSSNAPTTASTLGKFYYFRPTKSSLDITFTGLGVGTYTAGIYDGAHNMGTCTFTVNKASPSISISNKSVTYNGSAQTITGTISGVSGGANPTRKPFLYVLYK